MFHWFRHVLQRMRVSFKQYYGVVGYCYFKAKK
jgi:hypothetical protein